MVRTQPAPPPDVEDSVKPETGVRRRSSVRPWNRNEAEKIHSAEVRERHGAWKAGRPFDEQAFDAIIGHVRLSARQDDLYRVVLGDIIELGEQEGDESLSGAGWVRRSCVNAAAAWTETGERHVVIGHDGKIAAWERVDRVRGPQLWQTAVYSDERMKWCEIAAEQGLRGFITWVRQSTDYAAATWLLAHPRSKKEMQALLPLNVRA